MLPPLHVAVAVRRSESWVLLLNVAFLINHRFPAMLLSPWWMVCWVDSPFPNDTRLVFPVADRSTCRRELKELQQEADLTSSENARSISAHEGDLKEARRELADEQAMRREAEEKVPYSGCSFTPGSSFDLLFELTCGQSWC